MYIRCILLSKLTSYSINSNQTTKTIRNALFILYKLTIFIIIIIIIIIVIIKVAHLQL